MLALCDNGDPFAVCEYVAALRRPPRFEPRESEPLVSCTVVAQVSDPAGSRQLLDDVTSPTTTAGRRCTSCPTTSASSARLTLDGDTLTVSTESEPRVERVLALLRASIPDLDIVSDERVPFRPGAAEASWIRLSRSSCSKSTQPCARRSSTQWSGGGYGSRCPRWAASRRSRPPPTPPRREELERLLASFPNRPRVGYDPASVRLRTLLGLAET